MTNIERIAEQPPTKGVGREVGKAMGGLAIEAAKTVGTLAVETGKAVIKETLTPIPDRYEPKPLPRRTLQKPPPAQIRYDSQQEQEIRMQLHQMAREEDDETAHHLKTKEQPERPHEATETQQKEPSTSEGTAETTEKTETEEKSGEQKAA